MPARYTKTDKFSQVDYFDNLGGLNITDSPFVVPDDQATGGKNFEYLQTGATQKRRGNLKINSVADTQLRSRGFDIHVTSADVKTVVRAAGRKIQKFDPDALTFTNLSEDTLAAATDVFPLSTEVAAVYSQFNSTSNAFLNFAGNTPGLYAVISDTRYTKNGAEVPTGALAVTATTGSGTWQTTGTFKYTVSLQKASTDAISNATFNTSVTVTNTLSVNSVSFVGLTFDTTKYDSVILYRSTVNGSDDFTTGDQVATLSAGVVTYVDTGSAELSSENIPRPNSVILDNSTLPSGTYSVVTTWKRRLVTAKGSTLYFSDLNKPESWPTVNTVEIPTGSPIRALAVISFNTDFGNDEYLAVFKDRELWLVRGNDYTDISLSFIDAVGCPSQSLIVTANGYLSWIDYRGIFLWDGAGKPIYTSRPIEALFSIDGDLDKQKLGIGWGSFFRKKNTVTWYLSSNTYGEQTIGIKMDLRLTLPRVEQTLQGRILEGVFTIDVYGDPVYAAKSYLPGTKEERLLLGDNAGFVYGGSEVYSDGGAAIEFEYASKFMDCGNPNVAKRFNKVIVWVEELGDWNITLDYWAGYRSAEALKSTRSQQVSTSEQTGQALWDVAFWDVAYWDDYNPRPIGIVFNLDNDQGNSEGDCLKIKIKQSGADQPVTVYGYSLLYTLKGGIK